MSVLMQNTGNSYGGTGTSKTFSFTVAAVSGNVLFVIAGHWSGASSGIVVTGVTYAGVSLTEICSYYGNPGASNDLWMGYLVNPATGSNNVVISYSGSVTTAQWGTAYQMAGVNINNPVVSYSLLELFSGGPNYNISSEVGGMCIDGISDGYGVAKTVGSGQTQVANDSLAASSYKAATTTSTNTYWTMTSSYYLYAQVSFRPSQALQQILFL
jgi:hypothetical protein